MKTNKILNELNRITVYHIKGGVGKSRIALNLALSLGGVGIITNDEYSVIEGTYKNHIILKENDKLPVIPKDSPVIFDLGGKADPRTIEIIKQSQFILSPILPDEIDLQQAMNFLAELKNYNENIIIIINKTQKGDFEKFKKIFNHYHKELPVFEIKQSRVMHHIAKQGKSIQTLVEESRLNRYVYKKIAAQFQEILNYMTSK